MPPVPGRRPDVLLELVPTAPGEYVADGAARQAAWTLTGNPPEWTIGDTETYEGTTEPAVRERYATARDHVIDQLG